VRDNKELSKNSSRAQTVMKMMILTLQRLQLWCKKSCVLEIWFARYCGYQQEYYQVTV